MRCGCRVVLTGGSATQGVTCHELYLENFGSEHPVFSTALAFYVYKWSSLSLTGLLRSLTGRVYVYGVRNYQTPTKMNSDVPTSHATSPTAYGGATYGRLWSCDSCELEGFDLEGAQVVKCVPAFQRPLLSNCLDFSTYGIQLPFNYLEWLIRHRDCRLKTINIIRECDRSSDHASLELNK